MRSILCLAVGACCASSLAAATRDGDLDRNFGIDGLRIIDFGGASAAFGLALYPDGRIALGGYATDVVTDADFAAARLTALGAPDPTFSFDGRTTVAMGPANSFEQPFNLIVQSDGKIVVVGDAAPGTMLGVPTDMALARFNLDGSLDTTFSGDGKAYIDFGLATPASDRALDAVQLPDGKLIVVGTVAVTGQEGDFGVVKLNVDGSRDTSFDGDGRVTIRFDLDPAQRNEIASSVAIDSQGRILVAGAAEKGSGTNDFAVARLLPNGQLDNNFGGDGRVTVAFDLGGTLDDQVLEMIVMPNDGVILTGAASDAGYDAAVARLLPDGSLDPTFGGDGRVTVPFDLGGGNSDIFYGAELQADGRLLLVGQVELASPNYDVGLVRLLANGDLDDSFGLGGKARIALDLGGSLQDAAVRARVSQGALVFAGAADTSAGYLSMLAGRVIIDVLFSDGYDD